MAVRLGAHALGLVGEMPSGPGMISDELARDIARTVPPGVDTVLLTSRTTADGIADHAAFCGTSTVQIVQHIDPAEYPKLTRHLPALRRVQVIHVEDDGALDLIRAYEPHVHAFLLDSGRPNGATVELGGTGRVHDWRISAEFVRRSVKPVFLAGGLKPGNVTDAVREVRPYGVDLCSGVRTDGALDEALLTRFTRALWPAR